MRPERPSCTSGNRESEGRRQSFGNVFWIWNALAPALHLGPLGFWGRRVRSNGAGPTMSFCEHCEGQRFDRAQVLRALRQVRRHLRGRRCGKKVDEALVLVLKTVAALEIPHLDMEHDDGEVVH